MKVDRLSADVRRALMARIRSKNTAPEMTVRSTAHQLGYRFRLHRRDLPGTPDLVFPRLGLALFVHGCFWHRHEGCRRASTPRTRREFWAAKFERNLRRDLEAREGLHAIGWRTAVVWECECRDGERLAALLAGILQGPSRGTSHVPIASLK